jgi:hypothetical protein
MFIPCLLDPVRLLSDRLANNMQFPRRESLVLAEREWFKPEFGDKPIPLHMDMPGFVAIETEEEEPILTFDVSYGWHGGILSMTSF